MRCADATRQLQLYIDYRLTSEQFRVLEAHMSQCSACQYQLLLLEEVSTSLRGMQPIAEPADLTMRIMQRVAESPRRRREGRYSLLRPSLAEILAIFFLATITTFGIIWNQPTLRAVLPFANGHDFLSPSFFGMLNLLVASNSGPLTLALWVGGALLGICITLFLAGDEMRTEWFKAMVERLPVR